MKKIFELVVYLMALFMVLVGAYLFIKGVIGASFAINYNVGLIVTGLLFYAIGNGAMGIVEKE